MSGSEVQRLGQFSPWYEEYLIGKCGLGRDTMARTIGGDPEAKAQSQAAYNCGMNNTAQEARDFLLKEIDTFTTRVERGSKKKMR